MISTNACTLHRYSKIHRGHKRFLCQKAIAHTFLELKIFVPVVGHKQSIINFFILSFWDKWLDSFNCHYATDKFDF